MAGNKNHYHIEPADTVEGIWCELPMVNVGRGSHMRREPDLVGLVTHAGVPLFSIAVFCNPDEHCAFHKATIWQTWAVIGHGHSLYFVDLESRNAKPYWLDAPGSVDIDAGEGHSSHEEMSTEPRTITPYFGHLYTGDDYLLAATGSSLLRFDANADMVWEAHSLGIDGVLVHNIDGYCVSGDGEWDPPGGWLPFTLDLRTGHVIEQQHPPDVYHLAKG
ncbi:MAG: hypothetical protein JXB07_16580 [Anaerolineae bacterium]|nr:hypothetical protein [Anaerolineae bacterium]